MKQKQWIRVTIVFFVVIIILTIFSSVTAPRIRAKVTVVKPEPQTISHELWSDEPEQEYEQCVPVQCLRKNEYGQYFVYTTQEQDTVLETELIVREIYVDVLDKNEKYAAINGMIIGSVVVSTNKDLTDGSRVVIIE